MGLGCVSMPKWLAGGRVYTIVVSNGCLSLDVRTCVLSSEGRELGRSWVPCCASQGFGWGHGVTHSAHAFSRLSLLAGVCVAPVHQVDPLPLGAMAHHQADHQVTFHSSQGCVTPNTASSFHQL